MRDYAIDTKKIQFWDWAISKKLNRYEVREIIDITKLFDRKLDIGETIDLNDYCVEIENLCLKR